MFCTKSGAKQTPAIFIHIHILHERNLSLIESLFYLMTPLEHIDFHINAVIGHQAYGRYDISLLRKPAVPT